MRNRDHKNRVPTTVTSIPLVDPHPVPDAAASIGELVRDATTQVSTLVRAEVELAKAEITRDVKKGLTGSVFFIVAGVVLLYSTFFMFFFLAELLDTWIWRWAAFLIVFLLMLAVTALFAFLGYRKVRRIRGPQQTIESVKETTAALAPSLAKFSGTPTTHEAATPVTAAPPRATLPPQAPPRRAPAPRPTAPVYAAPVASVYEAPPVYETPEMYDEAVVYEETPAEEAPVYEEAAVYEEVVYQDAVAYEDDAVTYSETVVYEETPAEETPAYRENVVYEDGNYDPTAAVLADPDAPATLETDHRPHRDPLGW